ncbi:MAG: hypothetical protein GC204_16100 [Chloroflexi bacterium]|nr:hypothetical protein [Chloroflexota bacterium]
MIVEGQNDGAIAKALIERKYPNAKVEIRKPTGNKPNLSRLAEQISELVDAAMKSRQNQDCIAVLHDADRLTRPHDRQDYEKIERYCTEKHITHIEAQDEIESWLLADHGFCQWVGTNAENWDNQRKPSEEVARRLNNSRKAKYRLENIPQIVKHLDGSNKGNSESLNNALRHLENAPCIRA